VPEKFPDHESIAPIRWKHMFAGQLTIEDVCATCNNVHLSQLDNYASAWWDRNVRTHVTDLDADEPTLGRWLAKVTYNMQRIGKREDPGDIEPGIPEEVARWIIGKGPLNGNLGIVVGALPDGHDSAENAGHDSTNLDKPVPFRWTHLQGLVFMVVWRADVWKNVPPQRMVQIIADSMPGVALDLDQGKGPRRIPQIAKPDFVEAGLYKNLPLLTKITDYWKKHP